MLGDDFICMYLSPAVCIDVCKCLYMYMCMCVCVYKNCKIIANVFQKPEMKTKQFYWLVDLLIISLLACQLVCSLGWSYGGVGVTDFRWTYRNYRQQKFIYIFLAKMRKCRISNFHNWNWNRQSITCLSTESYSKQSNKQTYIQAYLPT